MQVIYHPDAEEEMLAAARYYESQEKSIFCSENLFFGRTVIIEFIIDAI